MSKLAKKLGEMIRHKRLESGISQDAFAVACGLDRSYMGRIERGETNITVEKLYLIARTLKCEPTDLLPSKV